MSGTDCPAPFSGTGGAAAGAIPAEAGVAMATSKGCAGLAAGTATDWGAAKARVVSVAGAVCVSPAEPVPAALAGTADEVCAVNAADVLAAAPIGAGSA